MAKKIFYDDDARKRVLGGAEMLYNAVKVTFGIKGRNVVIGGKYAVSVTHDGVSVANAIDISEVDDETLGYKVGADLIKEAARKLNRVAGDGTTTVTVLTYSILKEANRLIAAGYNPMELRKGIESAGAEVVLKLDELSEQIAEDSNRVAEIASISAGDETIGNLIADIIKKIGKEGIVTVETSQGLELESEIVEGFTLDSGFASNFFVTDTTRQEAVYDKPSIVITDRKINNIPEFLPVIEMLAQSGRKDVVIFADDINEEVLQLLIINKVKGVFNSVVVKAPSFGDRRKDIFEDLATLTGGMVISEENGMNFGNVDISVIGSVHKIVVGKDQTTIIKGNGAIEDINSRIEQIEKQITHNKNESERIQLKSRIASLRGKVAVIKVGGTTETEINEKKDRVDDAVAATKAALAEGIVAGGGVTLVNISNDMTNDGIDSFSAGRQILINAIKQPFIQIMENAGKNSQSLLSKIEEAKAGFGIDLNGNDTLIDLKKVGVIDPTKVTKEAIRNAVSIAATAATMGALIVDIPESTV
jgi:chaperonin GroEL